MTEKELLCKRFVANPNDDDIYEIVEQLIDLRTESCKCVFPSPKVCPRTAESPTQFGFCAAHMKTKKATELATRWNDILEELDVQESDDEESADSVSSEEEASSEEEVVPATRPSVTRTSIRSDPTSTRTVQPSSVRQATPVRKTVQPTETAPVRKLNLTEPAKPTRQAKPAVQPKKSNIQIETPPPVEEEESLAEGSAKAVYVDEEEEESPKLAPLVFKMGKFNNYINEQYKFVLRLHDETVLGTENKTGGIVKLTPALIKVCKEHNLNYLE